MGLTTETPEEQEQEMQRWLNRIDEAVAKDRAHKNLIFPVIDGLTYSGPDGEY